MEHFNEGKVLLNEELCEEPPTDKISIKDPVTRFNENINLAYFVGSKFLDYSSSTVDKDDILQSAYLGLWEACLRFDDTKGFKFSTFAIPTIKGSILKLLRDDEILKTTRSYKDLKYVLTKYNITLPFSESDIEFLMSLGFSKENIDSYYEPVVTSLYKEVTTLSDSGKLYLIDTIPDDNFRLDMNLYKEELNIFIDKVLNNLKLNPRSKEIVKEWFYSKMEGIKLSQSDLARKYNVSRSRISRLIKYITNELRMHEEEIKDLLFK